MLPLPIDYYVVKSAHRMPGIRTAFQNQEFYVYDAQDLKYPRR
jgi:chloramphenicol O-acetyltransferase